MASDHPAGKPERYGLTTTWSGHENRKGLNRMRDAISAIAGVLVMVGVLSCSGGGSGSSSSAPTEPPPPVGGNTVTVSVQDFQFEPKSVTINPGDTVRWVFDGMDKTHTSTAKDMTWDSQFVFQQVGDAFQWISSAADDGKTFEYKCTTHENSHEMRGSIRVGATAPDPAPGY